MRCLLKETKINNWIVDHEISCDSIKHNWMLSPPHDMEMYEWHRKKGSNEVVIDIESNMYMATCQKAIAHYCSFFSVAK